MDDPQLSIASHTSSSSVQMSQSHAAQEPLQPSRCRGNKVVSGLKVMRYLPPMGNLRATFELWGKFRLSFHRFWGEREEARRCGTGGSRRKRKLRGRGRTEVEAMGGVG
ncbi:hypothetical protein RIF29_24962 [Crotalaria pallida]|uniref:Uncharacterized protein n=1 Tax=Crotalaria pallida TaxID=3830 RepID=A0AAN9ELG2_CROPI